MIRRHVLLLAVLAAPALPQTTITILHTNDLHGHVEPVAMKGKSYGGYARHVTLVERFRAEDPNVLLLSGGDTFQGTLHSKVYEGLADLYFLERMGYDAMAAGNHEFDLGPGPLAAFARNASFPVLAANVDVSAEPLLAGLVKPHAVVEAGGRKIGLVGAVTPDLPLLSNPGPNVRMLDLVESVARSIEFLNREEIDVILLLSHLGYPLEKELAARLPEIDVIVGGHSHTLLGDLGRPELPAGDGPYPTVVEGARGERTLIVSSWQWGLVLGRIQVDFDEAGRVAAWREARPILVDEAIPEDPETRAAVVAFGKPIETLRAKVIGRTEEGLEAEDARRRECALGDVIADAFLAATEAAGTRIAFANGGAIRRSIEPGEITYQDVIEVQPFGNTLVVVDVTGGRILEALEHGVAGWADEKGGFLQVSKGFAYAFDLARPAGSRVVAATLDGEPIDPAATYRVAVTNFIARGGDGHQAFLESAGLRTDTGVVDSEATIDYLEERPGLEAREEGRIRVLGN